MTRQEYENYMLDIKGNTKNFLQIVTDFFGEENVDFHIRQSFKKLIEQDANALFASEERDFSEETLEEYQRQNASFIFGYIYIHFPKVDISNEANTCTIIEDLYVRIPITNIGTMYSYFEMAVTTYSEDKWNSGYAHSHLPRVYNIPEFKTPCLGTGPIKATLSSLISAFDADLALLFCTELKLYVSTESLKGGPYIRITEIQKNGNGYVSNISKTLCSLKSLSSIKYNIDIIKKTIASLILEKALSFNYYKGKYHIALDFAEFAILVTETYLRICKENNYGYSDGKFDIAKLKLEEVIVENQKLKRKINRIPLARNCNTPIFTFKGTPIYLHIHDIKDARTTYILYPEVINSIRFTITTYLNYLYKNDTTNQYTLCI